MLAIALQSGSNGNAIYVEADGVRLLFDAGISGLRARTRLAAHGRDISDVHAIIISHDHSDHISAAGIYQRKFGLPMYVTEPTLAAACRRCDLGKLGEVRHFRAGESLTFGRVKVRTVPTPHDGKDGVAFVVEAQGRRLGILTDLGHVFAELKNTVRSLDAVILESNYDQRMLEDGPYPAFLKARIAGPGGHLSNVEAAELLDSCGGAGLQWACLGHLSKENNTPQLAMATHKRILKGKVPLHLASRYEASGIMQIA